MLGYIVIFNYVYSHPVHSFCRICFNEKKKKNSELKMFQTLSKFVLYFLRISLDKLKKKMAVKVFFSLRTVKEKETEYFDQTNNFRSSSLSSS